MFDIPENLRGAYEVSGLSNINGSYKKEPTRTNEPGRTKEPGRTNSNIGNKPPDTSIILSKGQKIALSKLIKADKFSGLNVGLGWRLKNNQTYDIDSSCFMLGADGKVVGDSWFVFYNQEDSPDGSVHHIKGNNTGDSEVIALDFAKLNSKVEKIVVVITIENGHNFSDVESAYFRIINKDNNREIARHVLTDYYNTVNSMVTCEIYRHNGEWKINVVGNGLQRDLMGLCMFYGVDVTD